MNKFLFLTLTIVLLNKSVTLKKQMRIARGLVAEKDQFPFFVQLEIIRPIEGSGKGVSERTCGATLIHPQWILTSALCFYYLKDKLDWLAQNGFIQIYMGTNIRYDSKAYLDTVKKVHMHPEFEIILSHNGHLLNTQNDVAVGELKKVAKVNKHIALVELPPPPLKLPQVNRCQYGLIIGVGKTADNEEGLSKFVRFAMVEAVTRYRLHITIEKPLVDTVFYTESRWNRQHPLPGDYGGPYVCNSNGTFIQHGIMSNPFLNKVNGTFMAIYEEVDQHLNFILQKVPRELSKLNQRHKSSNSIEPSKHNKQSTAFCIKSSGYIWFIFAIKTVLT